MISAYYLAGGAQWLSDRVIDSRSRSCGFEHHWRLCVDQDTLTISLPNATVVEFNVHCQPRLQSKFTSAAAMWQKVA